MNKTENIITNTLSFMKLKFLPKIININLKIPEIDTMKSNTKNRQQIDFVVKRCEAAVQLSSFFNIPQANNAIGKREQAALF